MTVATNVFVYSIVALDNPNFSSTILFKEVLSRTMVLSALFTNLFNDKILL